MTIVGCGTGGRDSGGEQVLWKYGSQNPKDSQKQHMENNCPVLLETALIWLSAGGGLLLFMSVLRPEQERMAPILGSVLLMAVFCTATERMGKYGLYGRLDWEWFPSQGSSCSMDSF